MQAQKWRPLLEAAAGWYGVVQVELPVTALKIAPTDARSGLDVAAR
jgi:hypothetical protein